MKPLIFDFKEKPTNQGMDFSLVEYSDKFNLTVVRGTEQPAINILSMDTVTMTKAQERFLYISTCSVITKCKIKNNIIEPNFVSESLDANFFHDEFDTRNELEVTYADGKYIVAHQTKVYANVQLIEIKEFDGTTGEGLFNPPATDGRRIFYLTFDANVTLVRTITGMEFSASGRYLYVVTKEVPYLWIADISQLSIPSSTLNDGSQITNYSMGAIMGVSVDASYEGSQLELASDGKMYMYAGKDNFNIIENSDDLLNLVVIPYNPGPLLDHYASIGTDYTLSGVFYPVHLLNDQIDGENYNSFHAPTPECCSDEVVYDIHGDIGLQQDYYEILTNTNWNAASSPWGNGIRYIKDDLIVRTGAKLTLNGITLQFSKDAKLIVEKGASVVATNSTLTSVDCEGIMWPGVEVYGTQGIVHSSQFNANYGSVILNNSTVSNAINGITTAPRTNNNTYDLTQSGGYIKATSSDFINNQIDIDLTPHLSTGFPSFSHIQISKSYFKDCEFKTTTTQLKNNAYPDAHVVLTQVRGVKFYSNTFINASNDFTSSILNRGTGIRCYLSKFYVTYNCTSPQQVGNPCPEQFRIGNRFENLNYGIDASALNSLNNMVVEYSDFVNTHKGIRMVGMLAAKIDNNSFEIGADYPGTNIPSYSIHQTNCTGYFLQNNHFEDANNADYGVVTVNSGAFNNLIRNNIFEDLKYGATAINRNFGLVQSQNPQYVGLQYLCNDFTGLSQVDVQVTKTIQAIDGGIRSNQGFCSNGINTTPANNTFSPVVPILKHFTLASNVQSTNYHLPQDGNGFNVDPNNTSGFPIGYSETFCPNNKYDAKTIVCKENTYSSSSNNQILFRVSQSKSEIASLLNLIDAGSTQNLLNAIATQSAGQKKNSLMAASPYLSDEVLFAYLASNPPAGHFKLVVLANSPVSDDIMHYINSMSLPNGIRNQINEAQTGKSGMDVLTDDVSAVVWEKDMATDELIRRYLNDTINDQLDSLDIVLKANESQESDAIRVSVKIYQAKYTEAATLIADIRQITNKFDDYLKLMESLIIIEQCQDKAYRLLWDIPLKEDIESIANAGTGKQECQNAGSILEFLKIYSQPEVFQNVDPSEVRSFFEGENTVYPLQSFKIYPNPADHFVNIQTDKSYELLEIYIFDITGKQIQQQKISNSDYLLLETSKLDSGIYLIEVKMNGINSEIQKLIIE